MDNHEPGMSQDEWFRLQTQMNERGGSRMEPSTPEPAFDPEEPWTELPPLIKISPAMVFDLIEVLRQAGIPVRSPGARSAGLFSGGKVNVTLSVPERLKTEAARIVAEHNGGV
ncbi:MAG: hypothetical protein JXA97_11090 [Anaerolineales bacterium]|nr:hypothetical protein [Anaerolineales bacterium]